MKKELSPSFEPENIEAMINEYNQTCYRINVLENLINKSNIQNRNKLILMISTLQKRKSNFQKEFDFKKINFIKK